MSHVFDAAVALSALGEDRFSGAPHPAYANMVGPYGGITAATLLNAVLSHAQRQGDPISLTVNYAGPIAEGGFEIEARPARTNRSTQHWNVALMQQGQVAATATAVLATRRETWSAGEAQPPRDMPAAETLPRSPFLGHPVWTQHYDMRFAPGESPGPFDAQEQTSSSNRLWVRDDPPRPLDFLSLAAASDCFFPRIFLRRRALAPIGTVSLTVFFHADTDLLAAQREQHMLGTARALNFRNGYFDQSAELWSTSGELLACSHQLVYYRE